MRGSESVQKSAFQTDSEQKNKIIAAAAATTAILKLIQICVREEGQRKRENKTFDLHVLSVIVAVCCCCCWFSSHLILSAATKTIPTLGMDQ